MLKKKTNFVVAFHGWGLTASSQEPLPGGSLLFTTKFQKFLVNGIYLVKGFFFKNYIENETGRLVPDLF